MKNKCEICGAESELEEVYSFACDKDSSSATLCKKCKEKYFDYLLPGHTGILRYIPSVQYIPFLTYAENLVYAHNVRYGETDTLREKEITSMQERLLKEPEIRKTVMDTVDDILKRGNDAVIRKKQGGYVVIEDKKTIKYST